MTAAESLMSSPARSSDPGFTLEEVGATALFQGVRIEVIAPLLGDCRLQVLEPRDVLIAEGDSNQTLYLLLSGRLSVRLRSPDAQPLTYVEAGGSVGELSLIDHKPASASVVAEETTRVLAVEEDTVWMLTNASHAISSNLLFTLVERLRAGNDVIYDSMERLEQYRFHATVDALTGLFNRRWLQQMLPRQMHRSRANDDGLCLLMLDIDDFKPFNDRHGHVGGDHALGAVARTVIDNVRPGDMAVRFGGEEILVILPGCHVDGALVVAERLRSAVERASLRLPSGPELPGVTVSIGAAEMERDACLEGFVTAADQALYRAKRAGRNCVRT